MRLATIAKACLSQGRTTVMQRKQQEEQHLTARFLRAIGYPYAEMQSGDRPDIVVIIDGCRIGIEETKFHADEHSGTSGSLLRAKEAQKAKQSEGRSYFMWGVADPLPGIVSRIQDKIQRAAGYDASRYSELWLLISAQIPMQGGVAATFVFKPFVNVSQLNEATHSLLAASPFAAVHLQLVMSHVLFSWSREKQWYANQVTNG